MTDVFGSTIGLFADGPVGAAVMSVLAERCASCVSYVVVPSGSSLVATRRVELGLEIPLLVWDSSPDAAALPLLGGRVPDIVLLAWWPYLVRDTFLMAGQATTLNMHPSLLPYGRGKDPNFWALLDGDPFGVTIHHVDNTIDGGDVAFQSALPVTWQDTGATLYSRAQTALVDLFEEALGIILLGDIPRLQQAVGMKGFHRRSELEPRSRLELDQLTTTRDLLNLLRARTFPPHPACRFTEGDATYEVRVSITRVTDECGERLTPQAAADTRPARP